MIAPLARAVDPTPEAPLTNTERSRLAVIFTERSTRIPGGCWLWTGSFSGNGYGGLFFRGRNRRVHRLSYWLHYGEHPGVLHVMHKCDTPLCFNPLHLVLGTIKDNAVDCARKGRNGMQKYPHRSSLCGTSHPLYGVDNRSSKLTEEDVRIIRSRLAQERISCARLGREYGVSDQTIIRIKSGETWGWLT